MENELALVYLALANVDRAAEHRRFHQRVAPKRPLAVPPPSERLRRMLSDQSEIRRAVLLSEIIGSHTERLADALGALAGGTPPIESVRTLLSSVSLPVELLDWLAVLNLHAADQGASDSLLALERSIWADRGAWLESELTRRLPAGTDELYVATLASTIMSCFAAAEQTWIAGRDPQAPVDETAVTAFHTELDRALAYASAGWAPT